MRPRVLATTLLLATTGLAACGGGVDENAYVDQVTRVAQSTSSEATELSTQMSEAKTTEAIAGKLEQLGDAIADDSGDLGRIEAPDSVARQHDEYVRLMKGFGDDLKGLAGQVRDADTTQKANALLSRASKLTSDYATRESKLVQDINTELRG